MEYNVKIEAFEGPLDLLLHLINRYEIDIYDIPVAQITEQYMSYVHTMQELRLDVASEYLVMAATLLAIKSQMLLPSNDEQLIEDDFEMLDEEEDPRDELMRRLIEYRKYKQAAETLQEYEEERSQLYTRPPAVVEVEEQEPENNPVADVSLYDMLGALQKLLKRNRIDSLKETKITRQEIPIQDRMKEILTSLSTHRGRRSFSSLFQYPDREHIVVTFLALLELIKKQQIICKQEKNFEELWLYRTEEGVVHDT
ncbi:segregation/condensation protein A [Bacillus solimangrovi]|uniref:segregation/condensation protein A n=1 Tax=Bacillus solimangrovi TaxID=1305675 RepID=UPI000B06B678|nr:segregation/condensation protein A [Bacillus solimangrovi]